MGKRGGGRGNEGGLYPASITSDVLWTTTFHYPVAWSLSQVSACTLATLRAGDDSALNPQTCKSNAYMLTPVYSRQQDTPKGGKQANLCRAVGTTAAMAAPLFVLLINYSYTGPRQRHYSRYGHGHTGCLEPH